MGGAISGIMRGGVSVPQPIPGHGDADRAPATPGTSLQRTITQDHVSVGRTFAAFGIGAGAGIVPFFMIEFILSPVGRGTAILAASTILGGGVLAAVGGAALALAGHGPLHTTTQVANPDYDPDTANGLMAKELVGSALQVDFAKAHLSGKLGPLLDVTHDANAAEAPLFDKPTIDAVLAGTKPQRVVIELPQTGSTRTFATYALAGDLTPADVAATDVTVGVDLPKPLRDAGMKQGDFLVDAVLANQARTTTKQDVHDDEQWTLTGSNKVEMRGTGGLDGWGAFMNERTLAEGPWTQSGKQFDGYIDAGK